MTKCIWVRQYMRQGSLVREHQRCYNRTVSQKDKDLYETEAKKVQRKKDEYEEAKELKDRLDLLFQEAKQANSPLLPEIMKQRTQATIAADKKLGELIEATGNRDNLGYKLGISDYTDKSEVVTPDGLVIPALPDPLSPIGPHTKQLRDELEKEHGKKKKGWFPGFKKTIRLKQALKRGRKGRE